MTLGAVQGSYLLLIRFERQTHPRIDACTKTAVDDPCRRRWSASGIKRDHRIA
jgi:hypothetical protein